MIVGTDRLLTLQRLYINEIYLHTWTTTRQDSGHEIMGIIGRYLMSPTNNLHPLSDKIQAPLVTMALRPRVGIQTMGMDLFTRIAVGVETTDEETVERAGSLKIMSVKRRPC